MAAARTKLLVVIGVLAVTCAATPLLADAGAAPAQQEERRQEEQQQEGDGEQLARGRELYVQGCASCHGRRGQGIEIRDGAAGGPSLLRSGEAAAYYYLSTGRMPLSNSLDQPERNEPAYSDEDIDALVAYVASLGDGPALPEVDLDGADLAAGGTVYRANCQPCHGASGSGGALNYGRAAPGVASSTPAQVAAAVRIGPGQMPVFDTRTLDDDELDDLVRYVRYLQSPEDPGGLPIGRTGPIPEGFVAWAVGMVALLLLVVWIGTRSPVRDAARRARGGATPNRPGAGPTTEPSTEPSTEPHD
jgi:ubiquinol-cytochrome c reductase cytochrome c subunit